VTNTIAIATPSTLPKRAVTAVDQSVLLNLGPRWDTQVGDPGCLISCLYLLVPAAQSALPAAAACSSGSITSSTLRAVNHCHDRALTLSRASP
jgi:Protein of unknown function (DUF998)